MNRILFITGTDTGVGKTVLTALLARWLRKRGVNAAALKPIGSGGRGDARILRSALDGALMLDEINPWHFHTPIAPVLAARHEHQRVGQAEVLAHVRAMQKRFAVVLVEGAGGLLSPLGEKFDSRDLIVALDAIPIVVCPDRLGAVNQVLLTLEVLPEKIRAQELEQNTIALASAAGIKNLDPFRQRLECYKNRQPWRESFRLTNAPAKSQN